MFKGILLVNRTEQNSEKYKGDRVNARSLPLQPQCLPVRSERGLSADHSPKFFIRRLRTRAICFGAFLNMASKEDWC